MANKLRNRAWRSTPLVLRLRVIVREMHAGERPQGERPHLIPFVLTSETSTRRADVLPTARRGATRRVCRAAELPELPGVED